MYIEYKYIFYTYISRMFDIPIPTSFFHYSNIDISISSTNIEDNSNYDISNNYQMYLNEYSTLIKKINSSIPLLESAYKNMRLYNDNSYKEEYRKQLINIDILFAELVLLENKLQLDINVFDKYNKQLKYRIEKKKEIYNTIKKYYIKVKQEKNASIPRFEEFDYILKQKKTQILFYIIMCSVLFYFLWKKKIFGEQKSIIAENLGKTIKSITPRITL